MSKISSTRNLIFPDPNTADENGLLCVSQVITPTLLLEAYSRGIFPWPGEEMNVIPWFSPDPRGVLFFDKLHIPKTLQKLVRQLEGEFQFTLNKNFSGVIEGCAKTPRKGQKGTWITPAMKAAYMKFFETGFIMSLECWRDSKLVGGIYGVNLEKSGLKLFCGESMFGYEDNVSKLCLLEVIKILEARGHTWMDVQMVTPVVESFGAEYISRAEFLGMLG